ncbi:MAG: hypothetical protein HY537_03245 [Deltaproteobacteria bacterium]|nr:hypothetical protein [Deltaproteobacteria bacterium]
MRPHKKVSAVGWFVFVAIASTFVVFLVTRSFGLHTLKQIALRILAKPTHFLPVPNAQLGVRPNPNDPDHDSHGFRNAVFPKQADIVAMGDSQTYGVGCKREEAWPQQLSRTAKTTTYNLSYSSYGPTHYYILLDEALSLRPRIIVEALYYGNDFYDSYRHIYDLEQLPQFRSRKTPILQAIQKAEMTLPLSKQIALLFGAYIGRFPPAKHKLAVNEHPVPVNSCSSSDAVEPSAIEDNSTLRKWKQLTQQAQNSQGLWLLLDKPFLRTVFVPQYRYTAVNLNDSRIQEGIRISHEAIRLAAAQARKANTKFMVLLIPTKELAYNKLMVTTQCRSDNGYAQLIQKENAIRQSTKDFLQQSHIDFVDALPNLQLSMEQRHRVYPLTSDGHPVGSGQKVIAETVFSAIKERHWLENHLEIQK